MPINAECYIVVISNMRKRQNTFWTFQKDLAEQFTSSAHMEQQKHLNKYCFCIFISIVTQSPKLCPRSRWALHHSQLSLARGRFLAEITVEKNETKFWNRSFEQFWDQGPAKKKCSLHVSSTLVSILLEVQQKLRDFFLWAKPQKRPFSLHFAKLSIEFQNVCDFSIFG